MNLLLDTHTLLWWVLKSDKLSAKAAKAAANPENVVYVSAASAWEIATKYRLGKLQPPLPLVFEFSQEAEELGFLELPVTSAHASRSGWLEIPHKDPFDRMLIAQAQIEELTLVSNETGFDRFGIKRLW